MLINDLKSMEENLIKRAVPIIGSEKGKWLLKIVTEYKPKTILEFGTANGYSGIILGSEGAQLTTIDQNPRAAKEAMDNFKKFKISAKILIGEGSEVIKDLKGQKFDLIFLDFAKKLYPIILDDCIKMLNSKSILIADNINHPKTAEFKELILAHPKFTTTLVEIGDGLSFSILK